MSESEFDKYVTHIVDHAPTPNNNVHREDGGMHRYIGDDGTLSWFVNGNPWREGFPAIITVDSNDNKIEYWYDGYEYYRIINLGDKTIEWYTPDDELYQSVDYNDISNITIERFNGYDEGIIEWKNNEGLVIKQTFADGAEEIYDEDGSVYNSIPVISIQ